MQEHPPTDDEICALYLQGLSILATATRLGVGPIVVRKALARRAIPMRSNKHRSPARKLEMELLYARAAASYMSGCDYRDIERRLRVSKERTKRAVIRFGGVLRARRQLTDAEKAAKAQRAEKRAAKLVRRGVSAGRVSAAHLKHLYTEQCLTTQRIADMLGIDKATVISRLKRAGVKLRTRREIADLRHVTNRTVVAEYTLRCLYEVERLSIKATAARLGITHARTDRLLRRYNIVRRSAAFRTSCSKAA